MKTITPEKLVEWFRETLGWKGSPLPFPREAVLKSATLFLAQEDERGEGCKVCELKKDLPIALQLSVPPHVCPTPPKKEEPIDVEKELDKITMASEGVSYPPVEETVELLKLICRILNQKQI